MLTTTGDRPGRRPRLLVAALELPRADRSGGDLRFVELLGMMARRHEVDLCPYFADPRGAAEEGRYAEAIRRLGVRVLPAGGPHGLQGAVLRRPYDAAVFEFWNAAELGLERVRRAQPWAKLVVDSVDIHFRREGLGVAVGALDGAAAAANKARELAIYRAADAVVCVSEEEARILEAEGGVARLEVVPLVVPSRPRPPGDRGPEVLFLGGFRHAPNVDGLAWFVAAIWPAIRAAVPGARLTVIGSEPPAEVEALGGVAGVEVVGRVPEVGPHLDRAALMVAPLRFGAGVKTKVVEAMAAGLAVVTTTVGAQGLEATPGAHLLVADEPGAFAAAVVGLLNCPAEAERLGRAAREQIAPRCSPEAVAPRVEAMIARVVGPGRPALPPPGWWARSAGHRARRACARAAHRLGLSSGRAARAGAGRTPAAVASNSRD